MPTVCAFITAGLLKPYTAFELVSGLKASLDIPIHMQCHATTGMSTRPISRQLKLGRQCRYGDLVDEHDLRAFGDRVPGRYSPDQPRDTGLNIELLEEILRTCVRCGKSKR